jgi:hypothetical protein
MVEPVDEANPAFITKGMPAKIGPNTLEMVSFCRQTPRNLSKEYQRQIQLPSEMIGDDRRGSNRFRQETAVGTERAELDGKTATLRLAATLEDLLLILR